MNELNKPIRKGEGHFECISCGWRSPDMVMTECWTDEEGHNNRDPNTGKWTVRKCNSLKFKIWIDHKTRKVERYDVYLRDIK